MNLVQPIFGPEVSFIYPTTTAGSFSVAALAGTTLYKQTLVGTYELRLNILDFISSAVIGFKTFTVDIEDCTNVWNTPVNLTTNDYKLDSKNKVFVPAFINLTLVKCNPVTFQFRELSGVDLTNVIQI